MVTTDGRRVRGDERRARVLEAALPLATIQGLEGFSLDHLAAASGVPKGSIQILFKNKAGVQRSIIVAARQTVRTRILLPTAEAEPGIDRLLRFGERWIDYMRATKGDGGCFFSSVWSELQSKPGPLQDLVMEDRQSWLNGLTAAIEHGVATGQFTSVSAPADEALVLLGLGMTLNAELQLGRSAGAAWVNQVERFR